MGSEDVYKRQLERPLILVLNMMDLAEKSGLEIDVEALERLLGIPVVQTIATRGRGVTRILDKAIELARKPYTPKTFKYGREVEERIEKLQSALERIELPYPRRWIAIKLLEKDEERYVGLSARGIQRFWSLRID